MLKLVLTNLMLTLYSLYTYIVEIHYDSLSIYDKKRQNRMKILKHAVKWF